MKSISSFLGYRGLYEIFPECLVVYVHKDTGKYEKEFGFTINDTDEASIEYTFRQRVSDHVSKRPTIYRDLKMRSEKLSFTANARL
jgi:hypothetical protein